MMSPAHPPPLVVPAVPHAASFAPNVPAGTWPAAARPVTFVVALGPSRDVGSEASAELDVALRSWSRASCTSWRAVVGAPRALTPGDDGVNGVFFHDDAWPAELTPGAVAQTVVHLDADGNYRDADIHLDSAAFRFSLDGAPGTQDLRSILVHELGHALGLGHSSDARATMYPSGSGLRWRSLEADDVAGVCALYPGSGDSGCEVAACPSPFLCVAGACQRPGTRSDVCSPCDRVPGACEAAGDDARCIDLGAGTLAGRACGRACTTDASCGAGFHCRPTSAAGDLQCVADDDCRTAANACKADADCLAGSCHGGACLGAAPPATADAGPPDASDGGSSAAPEGTSTGGGCDCATGSGRPASSSLGWLGTLVLALAMRRRLGRRRHRATATMKA
ncbi:MAG: hypothetical protein JWP97_2021 [Labilithrix sp.]|nr:hypothetical protein [Labilithrix sp.]